MISRVLTLFKTLVQIILLRKGPEYIPHSTVLLVIVVALWLLVGVVDVMVVEAYTSSDLLMDMVLALVGLGFYVIIVANFGRSARLARCVTAILGCSIVFSVVLSGGRLVLPLLLTDSEIDWISQLIWFWSIPVEGHIIARTIERPWFIGFLIALAVLFAQLQLFVFLKPTILPAT